MPVAKYAAIIVVATGSAISSFSCKRLCSSSCLHLIAWLIYSTTLIAVFFHFCYISFYCQPHSFCEHHRKAAIRKMMKATTKTTTTNHLTSILCRAHITLVVIVMYKNYYTLNCPTEAHLANTTQHNTRLNSTQCTHTEREKECSVYLSINAEAAVAAAARAHSYCTMFFSRWRILVCLPTFRMLSSMCALVRVVRLARCVCVSSPVGAPSIERRRRWCWC